MNKEKTFIDVLWYTKRNLTQMCIGIVMFVVWSYAFVYPKNIADFQLHIIFSVTAYQFLMTEAILMVCSNLKNDNINIHLHMGLQLLAILCATAGFVFAVNMESENGHFVTAHGVIGLISLIFVIVAFIFGGLKQMTRTKTGLFPRIVNSIHMIFGYVTVFFGLIALCFGVNKDVFVTIVDRNVAIGITVIISLTMLSILLAVIKRCSDFAKISEELNERMFGFI